MSAPRFSIAAARYGTGGERRPAVEHTPPGVLPPANHRRQTNEGEPQ